MSQGTGFVDLLKSVARGRNAALYKAGLALVTLLLYIVVFLRFRPMMGFGVSALVTFPVALTAWFFGLRAGVGAALAVIPLNLVLLLYLDGQMDWQRAFIRDGLIGSPVIVFLGALIGYSSDLRKNLRRVLAERRRSEQTLEGHRRFLESAFNAIQDGITVLDKDMNILRVNRHIESKFSRGFPLAGRKCYHVFHNRSLPCENCPTRRALDRGSLQTEIIPRHDLFGPRGWLEIFAFPLRNAADEVIGVVEYVRDITERQEVEEKLRQANYNLERRSFQLSQILEISTSLRINLHLEQLLQEIVFSIRRSLGFETVILNLLDVKEQTVRMRACTGLDEVGRKLLEEAVYTPQEFARLTEERFRLGRCYFIPAGVHDWVQEYKGNANIQDAKPAGAADDWQSHDALIVPLEFDKGEVIGYLSLDNPASGKRPGLELLQVLSILSNQAAIAIQNAYLYAEVQRLAVTDALTGLYNRAFFDAEMERLQNGRQYPVSILMLDVDHLKKINDSLGHAAGDEALRQVAGVLREALRDEDVIARIGGDEFAVLLPGVDAGGAQRALLRVRDHLNHNHDGAQSLLLEISLGSATGEEGCALCEVFKRADKAMYRNKLARRRQAAITPQNRLQPGSY